MHAYYIVKSESIEGIKYTLESSIFSHATKVVFHTVDLSVILNYKGGNILYLTDLTLCRYGSVVMRRGKGEWGV